MQASSKLSDLLGMVSDAEASQRSYLLTDRESYLDVYNQEVPKINPLVMQIRDNYVALQDKSMLNDFSSMALTMREKLAEMELTRSMAMQGKKELARELVLTDFGKEKSYLLRTKAAALEARHTAKVSQAHQHSLGNQTLVRTVVGVVTVFNILLLLVFLVWLRREWNAQDQKHLVLEEQQRVLDELVLDRTRELEILASYLQTVSEREKASIARDLHDELGALLTASKMDVAWVRQQLNPEQIELGGKLDRAMKNLNLGVQAKRRVVENLVPSTLSSFGLVVALREYAGTMQEAAGWALDLDLPAEALEISDEVSIALFRIAQESINNITKYAGAKRVWVRLHCTADMISLEIEDDGVGFNQANSRPYSHGLAGMRQRTVGLRGKLEIHSQVGHGTRIQARLPLNAISA